MKVTNFNSNNTKPVFTEDGFELTPEYTKAELKIVEMLSSIPKASVPTPTKQYRFANQKVSVLQTILQFFASNKLVTFAAVFAFMLVGTYSVVQSAENSLPGQRLYSLKLASEQARLSLTFDQEKVANLHLAMAGKRLEETKRVIESNDPELEAAAITALTNQTEKTLEAVSQIATTKAVSQNDTSLLSTLVAMNKEQKTVLESAVKSDQNKESATAALSATKQTDKAIAKIIAAVNEQALLDLPNKISVTGTAESYSKNKLVVEKSVFTVNDATILLNQAGEIVEKFDKIEGKITVIGTKDNSVLIAKKIIIIDGLASLTPEKPQVKGVTTTVPVTQPKPTPSTTTPIITNPEPSTTEPQKPSQAQAGFIIEPSSSQYNP